MNSSAVWTVIGRGTAWFYPSSRIGNHNFLRFRQPAAYHEVAYKLQDVAVAKGELSGKALRVVLLQEVKGLRGKLMQRRTAFGPFFKKGEIISPKQELIRFSQDAFQRPQSEVIHDTAENTGQWVAVGQGNFPAKLCLHFPVQPGKARRAAGRTAMAMNCAALKYSKVSRR